MRVRSRSLAVLACCAAPSAIGQTAAPTEFEVASVKPVAAPLPPTRGLGSGKFGGPGTTDPGQITWRNASLKMLITVAYGLKNFEISGPSWLDTTGVDIIAKVPVGATKEQLPLLWQNLLLHRFHLTIHRETRDIPIYELDLAASGAKIKELILDPRQAALPQSGMPVPGPDGCSVFPGGRHATSLMRAPTLVRLCASGITHESAAGMLDRDLDRPVLNRTGLDGKYEFKLEFGPNTPAGVADLDPRPDVFAAFEQQLGLTLVPKKASITVLVIDSIDRVPTAN